MKNNRTDAKFVVQENQINDWIINNQVVYIFVPNIYQQEKFERQLVLSKDNFEDIYTKMLVK